MIGKHKAVIAYVLVLMLFTTYVFMDTFFITRVYGEETDASAGNENAQTEQQQNEDDDSEASMADQITSDDNDSEAGNMHSGSDSGGGHGNGSGQNGIRSVPGKGPGGKHRPGRNSDSGSSSDSGSIADANGSSGLQSSGSVSAKASSGATVSSDTYTDDNISITLKEYRENDTAIYVADVQVSDPSYLKTALAQGSYGRNVTQKTSEIADSVNAVLAINGDYYGAQEKGYVIRNGKLYRDTALANQEDLVIYKDGSFGIINESSVTAKQLISKGAVQTLSFGPALIQNGSIAVSDNEEVGRAMASNPRTAIGIIDENHYVFVVSDGRTEESEGLSLHELASFMDSLGVRTAYNLDGGGSSTMYFNGSVVNNTTGGMGSKERSVSDIVYIG